MRGRVIRNKSRIYEYDVVWSMEIHEKINKGDEGDKTPKERIVPIVIYSRRDQKRRVSGKEGNTKIPLYVDATSFT